MKKMFKVLAVGLLAAFSLSLSACNAAEPIRAAFPLNGAELTLVGRSRDITSPAEDGQGRVRFRSDLSLEELHALFRNSRNAVSCAAQGSVLMVSRITGAQGWYCLTETGPGQFAFGPAAVDLITDVDASGTRSVRTVLFPVHLLTDERARMSTPAFSVYPDTAYAFDGTLDAVRDFYQKGGWYRVEEIGDALVISGYRDDLTDQERQIIDSEDRLRLDAPVTLRLLEQDGENYVVFQV